MKGESLHLRSQDRFLSLHQTQVPLLGPPAEAVGLEEEEDQTGNGVVVADHRQFVALCWNQQMHTCSVVLVVEVSWVWVFS